MDAPAELQSALADRYRIERELGAGGMATVYLAHDLRHGRRVALKILRPELSAILGADRFLQEIKTTANLQHPHILPLHDSGECDGIVYYVMPYVEGESLRHRLSREKQLPVEDAVRITREVASALDYAHRNGVVHRDIKPENILLHDGQALVADFGIALAVSTVGGGTRMTETGMSLGTPHYMAPEQAMGEREITPRADVYALGCVAYEMLTGDPPFTGSTAQAVVARVVTERPRPLVAQRHTIPAHVEAAVMTALEKLPADRFASAADLATALGNPMYGVTAAAPMAPAFATVRNRWSLLVPAAALGTALAALTVWLLLRDEPHAPVIRYGLALPKDQAPVGGRAIPSPDGSVIVYFGPGGGPGQMMLWAKRRDEAVARPIPGTANTFDFTFSPDGEWLAIVQGDQLKRMPLAGGAPVVLADSVFYAGLAWLDDGTIVFARRSMRELSRVGDTGGEVTTVWQVDTAFVADPTPLPGGRGVLFMMCPAEGCAARPSLAALDFGNGTPRIVMRDAAHGRYVRGKVVFARPDGGLFAGEFDLGKLAFRGAPIPILDGVASPGGFSQIAIGDGGTLVMRPASDAMLGPSHEIVIVDRAGVETAVDTSWRFRFTQFGGNVGWSVSPDGRRLAIGLNTDAGDHVWIKQLPRGPLSRLSFDSAASFRPRWTPDGRRLTFMSNRGADANAYMRSADGTGGDSLLLDLSAGIYEAFHTSDGQWVVYRTGGTIGATGGRDIYGFRPGVDREHRPLIVTRFDESAPTVSPDGRWIAYESNETGRKEVYVRPFPEVDSGKWQISANGGAAPLWSRDGRELYHVSGDREMVATAIGAGGPADAGESQVLFRMRPEIYLMPYENYTPHDILPDGRFVMARLVRSGDEGLPPLVVVENWFTELEARLRTRTRR